MTGDILVGRGLQDLHDSVLRVMCSKGAKCLMDPDIGNDSSSTSSSIRGVRRDVLFAEDRIHHRSVTRGKVDATVMGRRCTFSQRAL